MADARTHDEMRAELLGKAAQDTDFRARLVADPKAAIEEALGLELPESVTVQVHEDTAQNANLVLPPEASLTTTDLEFVAGGGDVYNAYGGRVRHKHSDGTFHD